MAYVKQRGEDTYLVRIMIGTDENGRPIQRSRTFHPSTSGLSKSKLQKEIDAFVEKFENEFSTDVPHADKITQNDLTDNAPPSDVVIPSKRVERPVVAPILPEMTKIETIPTFAEFCEDYRQVKMKLLSPTCWQLYENVLTKYFIPMFGQMRLNEIRPSHVQKAIDFFTSPEGRTDGRGEVLGRAVIPAPALLRPHMLSGIHIRPVPAGIRTVCGPRGHGCPAGFADDFPRAAGRPLFLRGGMRTIPERIQRHACICGISAARLILRTWHEFVRCPALEGRFRDARVY